MQSAVIKRGAPGDQPAGSQHTESPLVHQPSLLSIKSLLINPALVVERRLENVVDDLDTLDSLLQILHGAEALLSPHTMLAEPVVEDGEGGLCVDAQLEEKLRQLPAVVTGDGVALPPALAQLFEPCAVMGEFCDFLLARAMMVSRCMLQPGARMHVCTL